MKVALSLFLIVMVGGLYAVYLKSGNPGIPCLLTLGSGLKCSGCGITHMFMFLFEGNLKAAFEANSFMLCSLPFAIAAFCRYAWRYVNDGVFDLSRIALVALLLWAAIGVIFAIARNL